MDGCAGAGEAADVAEMRTNTYKTFACMHIMRKICDPYGDQGICVSTTLYRRLGGFDLVPLMEDVLLAQRMKMENIYPKLLPAIIEIDARRWQQNGVLAQTMRNWRLLRKLKRGVSPMDLVTMYQRHE